MGLDGVRDLLRKTHPSAFKKVSDAPFPFDVLVFDANCQFMRLWVSESGICAPIQFYAAARKQYLPFLSSAATEHPVAVVVVSDKADAVPIEKDRERKRRADSYEKQQSKKPKTELSYYPEGGVWTDQCLQYENVSFRVEPRKVMRSRPVRPGLFAYLQDWFVRHPVPCHSTLVLDFDIKEEHKPTIIGNNAAFVDAARQIGKAPDGEADLGTMRWIVELHKKIPTVARRFLLRHNDSDALAIGCKCLWDAPPELEVYWNWEGKSVVDLRELIRSLKRAGWTLEAYLAASCVSGSDYFDKEFATYFVGLEVVWTRALAAVLSGTLPRDPHSFVFFRRFIEHIRGEYVVNASAEARLSTTVALARLGGQVAIGKGRDDTKENRRLKRKWEAKPLLPVHPEAAQCFAFQMRYWFSALV